MDGRIYLGDGEHYFTIREQKYTPNPLLELFKDGGKNPIFVRTVTFKELTKQKTELMNELEVWIMRNVSQHCT